MQVTRKVSAAPTGQIVVVVVQPQYPVFPPVALTACEGKTDNITAKTPAKRENKITLLYIFEDGMISPVIEA
ncbi:hypothetical protein FUA23_22075 [Neolewinella aurantiaca]|uniref:Uncharacterized protein n=1 Tax=Neolewinella aurantiaca TaxID=2602767 RepID=A0A5C7EZ32_9BACT|nr:hypothetical protein FUA23_22075 [Neolewinella aurantiaca]